MALAALEAVLDAESDAAVRECWRVLHEAGLPSQAMHRSPTNAPHLTLVAAATLDEEALALGAGWIVPLLPLELPVSAASHSQPDSPRAFWWSNADWRATLALSRLLIFDPVGLISSTRLTPSSYPPSSWASL